MISKPLLPKLAIMKVEDGESSKAGATGEMGTGGTRGGGAAL